MLRRLDIRVEKLRVTSLSSNHCNCCVFITALWLYVFGSSDDLNIECQPHKRGHIRGHLSSFTLPRSPIKPSACHMAHCSFFFD